MNTQTGRRELDRAALDSCRLRRYFEGRLGRVKVGEQRVGVVNIYGGRRRWSYDAEPELPPQAQDVETQGSELIGKKLVFGFNMRSNSMILYLAGPREPELVQVNFRQRACE